VREKEKKRGGSGERERERKRGDNSRASQRYGKSPSKQASTLKPEA